MAESGKVHVLYGPWLYGQVKSLVDQANQRKSEVPAEHSAEVHSALNDLQSVLGRLQKHAK